MPDPSFHSDIEYLQRLAISHVATRILMSGLQIGVFEAIGDKEKNATEISKETSSSLRGMRILLDCLVSFHLLAKSEERYRLAPISSRYLVKGSPDYVGYLWEDERLMERWNHLNDAIRTGKPLRKAGTLAEEATSFSGLARSLHVVHQEPAENATRALGAGTTHLGMNVLDVACGSGVWGIAIAKADSQSRIVAHDLPEILEMTKSYVNQNHVENQFNYLPGDLKTMDFGECRFDLAVLGNIIHSEGEHSSRELLRRVHRSLKPSGRIAIIDIIPEEGRIGPQASLIVALAMLLDTEEGDLFTISEYRRWLGEAGFAKMETIDIGSHSPLLLAHKAASQNPN